MTQSRVIAWHQVLARPLPSLLQAKRYGKNLLGQSSYEDIDRRAKRYGKNLLGQSSYEDIDRRAKRYGKNLLGQSSYVDIDRRGLMKKSDNLNVREGTVGNQGADASGASCDGTPKASKSSPLVSRAATINMPCGKDLAQKAKVKWVIEGDENFKFFHGIVNKKRQQMAIRGVSVNGIKIGGQESVNISQLFYADDAVFIGE
ncbi:hypothetical protein Tco_0578147 [Tanacetum coccineum]